MQRSGAAVIPMKQEEKEKMRKIAFLYPGQGAQEAGMGKDFYDHSVLARNLYDQANEVLDFDVKSMCFLEDERLNQTEYTQAAMVVTSLAMTQVLKAEGIYPDITAGLSLGEYCAIAAAGGMAPMDAVRLVRIRGKLMQNAVPVGEGAMCAVIKMDAELIEKVIEPIEGVTIANYNCPDQIVITGRKRAVKEAAEELKKAGAKRCLMLNVSGPFHSSLMISAGEKLAEEIERIQLSELTMPYVTNVTASIVNDIRETKDLLVRQMSAPVKWMQSMETMLSEGVNTFVEIGPGSTLAKFMKKIAPEAEILNIAEFKDIDTVVKWIGES